MLEISKIITIVADVRKYADPFILQAEMTV